METTLLQNQAAASLLPQPAASTVNPQLNHFKSDGHNTIDNPLRLGPVFYAGRSPFRIKVIILTCFAVPENNTASEGIYITYVGYKKEADPEFDFDEMIHSPTFKTAELTHQKACGFFSNSKLFVESLI